MKLRKGLAAVIAVAAAVSALAVPSLAADDREECGDPRGRVIQRLRQEAEKALGQMLQRPSNDDCIYPQLQWKPEDCPEQPGNPDLPPEFGEPAPNPPEENRPDTDWPDVDWPDNSLPDSTPPSGGDSVPETPEQPDEETPEVPDSMPEYAREVVRLVNEERAKAGLKALQVDTKVQQAAQVRAKEQPVSFSHTRPDGASCFTALTDAGVNYRGAGENIAMGQRSPQEVMNGWMNSSGHRANILSSSFTHIGVGVYESGGRLYWAQMFT